jgi:hypothetical protein
MKTGSRSSTACLVTALLAGTTVFFANPSASSAAGWSTPAVISPVIPRATPNVFATDPAGNQLWVTTKLSGTGFFAVATIQAAQRSAGGAFGPFTDIFATRSPSNLSVGLSARNVAAVAWQGGPGIQIAVRSAAGLWQTPAGIALSGTVMNLKIQLDSLGNGVAVWTRLAPTIAVIEAVSWTAAGSFQSVTQLSPMTHGSFLPDLAVNEAGTAVVVWQAAGLLDNSNPYQIETITRPLGGNWGPVITASPVASQTWVAKIALDRGGNAAIIWEQGATVGSYSIYSASRPKGGAWSPQVKLEQGSWDFALGEGIVSDAAGNITASWIASAGGVANIRTASRSVGGNWTPAVTIGTMSNAGSFPPPQLVASRDGSIIVVQWAYQTATPGTSNTAISVNGQAFSGAFLNTRNTQPVYVLASNNARASAFWTELLPPPPYPIRSAVVKQSDLQ